MFQDPYIVIRFNWLINSRYQQQVSARFALHVGHLQAPQKVRPCSCLALLRFACASLACAENGGVAEMDQLGQLGDGQVDVQVTIVLASETKGCVMWCQAWGQRPCFDTC